MIKIRLQRGLILCLLVVFAFILPATLSDKTEDDFEYAAAPIQKSPFVNVPGENQVDKLQNKANILTLPRNYSYDPNFPDLSVKFGPVTAVSMDNNDNVAVLHRFDRIWDATTFLLNNQYRHKNLGPISEYTVYTIDRRSGKKIRQWGKDLFYLPHGLTIDRQNNAYVTDVALHQVFRFNLNSTTDTPTLILGQKFTPGTANSRFCKPTSVAVISDGNFFVADGYCNARVMEFNANGQFIRKWGQNAFSGIPVHPSPENVFAVPHALTLVEEPGRPTLLCVADRENGRVQCFDVYTTNFVVQYHNPIIGSRIFSVAYAKGFLYVVNGPELYQASADDYHEVNGFVIDMNTAKVVSKFGPNDRNMSSPHDIAVSRDGSEIFVAELDPNVLMRFVWNNGTNRIIQKQSLALPETNTFDAALSMRPGVTLLIASGVIFMFCLVASGFVLFLSRRRRRGCLPMEVTRNRRHAWDNPGSGPQFKLGSLLDRKKGFEKLGQDASDDENSPGGPNSSSSQQGLLSEQYT